jgi:hypothetical protein
MVKRKTEPTMQNNLQRKLLYIITPVATTCCMRTRLTSSNRSQLILNRCKVLRLQRNKREGRIFNPFTRGVRNMNYQIRKFLCREDARRRRLMRTMMLMASAALYYIWECGDADAGNNMPISSFRTTATRLATPAPCCSICSQSILIINWRA